MAFAANTTLRRQGKPDIAEGTQVKKSDFGEEVWEQLVASGSVKEIVASAPENDDEKAELQKQVEELKAQLAAAREGNKGSQPVASAQKPAEKK